MLCAAAVLALLELGLSSAQSPAAAAADPSEQLQRDLNAAIAAGSSTFSIAPGVYRPKRDLLLDNARDLSIGPGGGGSVTLLFTCNWGLVLRSSINVSVSGVTIGYDPPCFSQGIIQSSTPSGALRGHSTFTYTLDDGFPAPIGESATSDARFAQAPIVKCICWDPDTQLSQGLKKLAYTSGSPTNQGPRHIKHLGGRSYQLVVYHRRLDDSRLQRYDPRRVRGRRRTHMAGEQSGAQRNKESFGSAGQQCGHLPEQRLRARAAGRGQRAHIRGRRLHE